MATLAIEVPESILEQLRVWVAAGKILSEQAFVADLVVEAVDRLALAHLQEMLDAGRSSGFRRMDTEDWDALLERVRGRTQAHRDAGSDAAE